MIILIIIKIINAQIRPICGKNDFNSGASLVSLIYVLCQQHNGTLNFAYLSHTQCFITNVQ